jgi:hypothetical protein
MAMFNATPLWGEPIRLEAGQNWTATLRAAAYEGAVDPSRAVAWREARFG